MHTTDVQSSVGAEGSHPKLSPSSNLWRSVKAVVAFVVGVALTLAYFATATREYDSEAKLFVKIGRQSVSLDPTATTGQTISIRESENQEVFAIQELFLSRKIAEEVVDHFGSAVISAGERQEEHQEAGRIPSLGGVLAPLNDYNLNPLRVYSHRDKAIKAFGQNLTVLAGKRTSILSLAYRSQDAAFSQEVLQYLLDLGLEEHLNMHHIRGSQQFFVEQSKLLREGLVALEQELRDLKSTTGVASLETQRDSHLGLIASLRQELLNAQAQHAALEEELTERRRQHEGLPSMIVLEQTTDQPQTVTQMMRQRLYELEVQERGHASKYTENHPKMVQAKQQVAAARAIADEVNDRPAIKTGTNQNYQASQLTILERESQVVALETRIAVLTKDIEQAEAKLTDIINTEFAIRELEREISLASANYRTYSENLEQARINSEIEAAKISSLNVLQEPTLVETPSSPKPSVTLGAGGILSLLFAAVVSMRSKEPSPQVTQGPIAQASPSSQNGEPVSRRHPPHYETKKPVALEPENVVG